MSFPPGRPIDSVLGGTSGRIRHGARSHRGGRWLGRGWMRWDDGHDLGQSLLQLADLQGLPVILICQTLMLPPSVAQCREQLDLHPRLVGQCNLQPLLLSLDVSKCHALSSQLLFQVLTGLVLLSQLLASAIQVFLHLTKLLVELLHFLGAVGVTRHMLVVAQLCLCPNSLLRLRLEFLFQFSYCCLLLLPGGRALVQSNYK